jgi:hypothetical protein
MAANREGVPGARNMRSGVTLTMRQGKIIYSTLAQDFMETTVYEQH